MKRYLKKLIATLTTVTTMAVGVGSLNVNALSNRYSTFSAYKSGSYVYFGGYATNLSSQNAIDFTFWGDLYNNTDDSHISGNVFDTELDVGYNIQGTLKDYHAYSDLPTVTRCEVHISAYYSYSTYAPSFESYTNNVYYYK